MADLDDFFAKKDRKKNKGKKFTTTDEIAKKLEESGKKAEKAKKEKLTLQPQQLSTEGDENVNQAQEEDDEWKDFEEEKKDYSGLRIGNLTLTECENEGGGLEGEEQDVMEENEAGEMVPRRKVQSGPWKIVTSQPQSEPEPTAVIEKRPEVSTPGGSVYRPPCMRNQSKDSHPSPRIKSKAAPDINSEEFFPTLSATKSVDPRGGLGRRRRDEGAFEEVRNSRSHSTRYAESATTPHLSLGNKFGALSQDQS